MRKNRGFIKVAHAAASPSFRAEKTEEERLFFDEKRERFHHRPIFRFNSSADDEKEREKERQEDTFSKRHPKMFISPFLFFLFFKIQ